MCKLKKACDSQAFSILPCDKHQSAATFNVSQREFMPTSMPLSSCLLLNPLENSPPKVLWNALHQSHTNERHYTLQSVWFKDDLQPFPAAVRNGNLPRDKPGIHLQYSKDIKGFKLCIGGVAVRTAKIGFYQMWNFHNRVRGLRVVMIPESMAAFMICSWACTRRMFGWSVVASTCDWCCLTQTLRLSVYRDIPNVLEVEQITLFIYLFRISASHIQFPCAVTPNIKPPLKKKRQTFWLLLLMKEELF